MTTCKASVKVGPNWYPCRAVNRHSKHWSTIAPWPTITAAGLSALDGRIVIYWVDRPASKNAQEMSN